MGNRIRDKIKNFLRLRKQSDTVKIICLFTLAGVAFFVSTIYHVWEIYQHVNTSAEYILTADEAISNKRMNELLQSKDVRKASRQMKTSVSLLYGGTETTVDCTMLSPDYMAELFGTEIPEGTSRIYMNEAAFSEFEETISEKSESMIYKEAAGAQRGSELAVRYYIGEDMLAAGSGDSEDGDGAGTEMTTQNYRSAKLMVVKMDGAEAESFIYTPETERLLLREAASIRVKFGTHDLDGLHVDNIRKLGYEIEQEETIQEEEYELQIKLLHIRYGLVICGICIVGAAMLKRKLLF